MTYVIAINVVAGGRKMSNKQQGHARQNTTTKTSDRKGNKGKNG